jgi:hypothetical protein
VFTIHFAALPFLAITLINALRKPSNKHFFLFFLANLLFSSQGFVPTVFIAYLILLASFLLFHIIFARQWKQTIFLVSIVFAANAFWMLPYTYSALKTPPIIKNARINQFSSEEIYYRNKAFGDIGSVLSMNGFMLDTIETDTKTNDDVFLMQQWRTHQQSLLYRAVMMLIIITLVYSVIHIVWKKERALYPYVLACGVAFFFLANNTPGLEQLNAVFRTVFPLLGEAFRFPFTKFITLFAFCYTVLLAYGLHKIGIQFSEFAIFPPKADPPLKDNFQFSIKIISLAFIFMIYILAAPAFQGYFTSPFLRLTIPQDYFQLFTYFKTVDPNQRIALLPAYSFWNWQYRDWEYRGSGFHWYGIAQPTMHRAFDPWSSNNEQFYNELSSAISTNDRNALQRTILKYDIAYIVLDRHTTNSLTKKPINYEAIEEFLLTDPTIQKAATFGRVSVYKNMHATSWVTSLSSKNALTVYPDTGYTNKDVSVSSPEIITVQAKTNPDSFSIFPALYTNKLQENSDFVITEHPDSIDISPKISSAVELTQHVFHVPALTDYEFLIPIEVTLTEQGLRIQVIQPEIMLNNKPIKAQTKAFIYPTKITTPDRIVFADIQQTIIEPTKPFQSYLLNDRINTITVQKGRIMETITVDPTTFHQDVQDIPFAESTLQALKIRIPKIASPLSQENAIGTLPLEIQYPDRQAIGYTKKSFERVTTKNDHISMQARKSSVSVALYDAHLFHQAAYVVFVDAKHEAGLPIDFYIDNTFQSRAEVETKLSTTTDHNTLILPVTEQAFSGYGMHTIVRSVGTETAQATLSRIGYFPIPQEWLMHLRFTNNKELTNTQPIPMQFERSNPSYYTTTSPRTGNYILLSQAYDEGWKAYRIENGKLSSRGGSALGGKIENWMKQHFPFVFGKELGNHVVVNNWKNGWLINQSTSQPVLPAGRQATIVLLYLPQYLQYIGFIITGVTMVSFIYTRGTRATHDTRATLKG